MRKLLIVLAAASALAAPATASASFGHVNALFATVSGTGTSFGSATATASGDIVRGFQLSNGHFSLSLNTTWSSATTHTFPNATLGCAPATATLTLTSGSTTKTLSLTGRTCSLSFDGTGRYIFLGHGSPSHGVALLREEGTTVRGFVGAFELG